VRTYTVTAKRWKHGWELHIDDVGVTQSRTLTTAEQMVRDYVETLLDIDASDAEVVIVPELGGLEDRARKVREHAKAAEQARREAAREARELAKALRAEGLSISDTAAVLGVSRGRVSQLVKSA
jgi:DNA-directed RNA polymerase specialized sigma subunit